MLKRFKGIKESVSLEYVFLFDELSNPKYLDRLGIKYLSHEPCEIDLPLIRIRKLWVLVPGKRLMRCVSCIGTLYQIEDMYDALDKLDNWYCNSYSRINKSIEEDVMKRYQVKAYPLVYRSKWDLINRKYRRARYILALTYVYNRPFKYYKITNGVSKPMLRRILNEM